MSVNAHECRSCRSKAGHVVLDLGDQPAVRLLPAVWTILDPTRFTRCRCGSARAAA